MNVSRLLGGDGNRVSTAHFTGTSGTPDSVTSYFMGGQYEVKDGATKKYYSIAGMTVAMQDVSGLQYLLTDHLGSTVAVTNSSGTLTSQQRSPSTSSGRRLPFGGVRSIPNSPILSTDFGYTGQRLLDAGMGGIMDYKARFYSPALGRFLQPDTIIPDQSNPQSWNRYLYVLNNPILYNDPTGHCAGPVVIVCFIVGIVLMTSAIDSFETNAMDASAAAQAPSFSIEQHAIQQWQDNCMGECHYAHSTIPGGSTGPRPVTPLVDQYSSAMGGVVNSIMQFTGGASFVSGIMPPTRYSDYDVRMNFYLKAEAHMDDLAPTDRSLEYTARWYFDYRNFLRSRARYLMADRDGAINLELSDPNFTFEELMQHKIINKGLSGDDIYIDIINSAPKSRTSVNQSLGIHIPE